jgi:hypothetical protein
VRQADHADASNPYIVVMHRSHYHQSCSPQLLKTSAAAKDEGVVSRGDVGCDSRRWESG